MSQLETRKNFVPPTDAKAALFFLEGHYQLNYLEDSVVLWAEGLPTPVGNFA